MQEYISQSNIERFKKLIRTTTDPQQLSTLKDLLRLEDAKSGTHSTKQGH